MSRTVSLHPAAFRCCKQAAQNWSLGSVSRRLLSEKEFQKLRGEARDAAKKQRQDHLLNTGLGAVVGAGGGAVTGAGVGSNFGMTHPVIPSLLAAGLGGWAGGHLVNRFGRSGQDTKKTRRRDVIAGATYQDYLQDHQLRTKTGAEIGELKYKTPEDVAHLEGNIKPRTEAEFDFLRRQVSDESYLKPNPYPWIPNLIAGGLLGGGLGLGGGLALGLHSKPDTKRWLPGVLGGYGALLGASLGLKTAPDVPERPTRKWLQKRWGATDYPTYARLAGIPLERPFVDKLTDVAAAGTSTALTVADPLMAAAIA